MARRACITGTAAIAVALTNMLAVGLLDSAFAAKNNHLNDTPTTENRPVSREDWPPIPNMSAQFYRGGSHQSRPRSREAWPPVQNMSAQFYRSGSKQRGQPKTSN